MHDASLLQSQTLLHNENVWLIWIIQQRKPDVGVGNREDRGGQIEDVRHNGLKSGGVHSVRQMTEIKKQTDFYLFRQIGKETEKRGSWGKSDKKISGRKEKGDVR
ncbi:hypothetical protein EXN66_Car013848 [Channa argus]|uniref:Uncharacterized protein n=1 Tax=Channa argus TaxID=215402 RepID=A0A6G1Q6N4_CHAAH|nr:hypothetical protein EXN66_Car013848 [Channa argus]